MSVSISDLPDRARIWVYGTDRTLLESETGTLAGELLRFVDQWTAHGAALRAAVEIVEDRFAVIAVDESSAPASGCSIDAMVRALTRLEDALGCSLLDGTRVFYRSPDGSIEGCDRATFRTRFSEGAITEDTSVFDPTIATLGELRSGGLEGTLADSWHRRLVRGARAGS